ncbi:MAG: type II toxin-antitoxin system PemK/MazF family toxin [Candidatus Acidiferrales bacterium]
MSSAIPSRGEIWSAHIGEPPALHWVVVVSLNARNHRAGIGSILIVPFSSKLHEGPTTMILDSQETGLPRRSCLRAHFIQPLTKSRLVERLARQLSGARMQDLCVAIRRSFDPDAPY